MRPIRALLTYLLVVFIGGALLAPWLYWLAQTVAPGSHMAASPFHRFVDRSLEILGLAGLWPLLRGLGASSARDLGLVAPDKQQWRRFATGFLLGFGSLTILAAIILTAHGRQWNAQLSASQLCGKLLGAVAGGLAVAVVEEILFRGGIMGGLRRVCDWRVALVVSSMIYAILHFLARVDIPGPIHWYSGLELLPRKLEGFVDLRMVVPGFFNLTLVGLMLGLAYQRTGNLYFSIGLHAGWVFTLLSYGSLTLPVKDANLWLFGTIKLTDGWLTMAILVLTLPALLLLLREKPKSSPT